MPHSGGWKKRLRPASQGLRVIRKAASEKEAADVNLVAQLVARLRLETGGDPSDVIDEALRRFPGDHAMRS